MCIFLRLQELQSHSPAQEGRLLRLLFLWVCPVPSKTKAVNQHFPDTYQLFRLIDYGMNIDPSLESQTEDYHA